MADTKFTPGPWRVVERASMDDGSVYPTHILGGAADFHVCLMESAAVAALLHSGEWKTVVSTSAANANLIAAAPDLHDACQTFHAWLLHEETGFDHGTHDRNTPEGEAAWREWWSKGMDLCALAQEQVRAALAKARGEQP